MEAAVEAFVDGANLPISAEEQAALVASLVEAEQSGATYLLGDVLRDLRTSRFGITTLDGAGLSDDEYLDAMRETLEVTRSVDGAENWVWELALGRASTASNLTESQVLRPTEAALVVLGWAFAVDAISTSAEGPPPPADLGDAGVGVVTSSFGATLVWAAVKVASAGAAAGGAVVSAPAAALVVVAGTSLYAGMELGEWLASLDDAPIVGAAAAVDEEGNLFVGSDADEVADQAGLGSVPVSVVLFEEDFDDGDFSSNPGWTLANGDDYPADAVEITAGALYILRDGAGGNGGSAGIQISTDIDLSERTIVQLDVRPVERSVVNGNGNTGGEYPINLQLGLELADGRDVTLRYAFNYDGAVLDKSEDDFIQVATDVSQDTWSYNMQFEIQDSWPTAERVTELKVFGAGWDFESYADNIKIYE